jgi:transposase
MRSKRAEWEKRVRGWRRSGLTAAEYAESIGVNVETLRHWSWRLKREGEASGATKSSPAVSSLVEVVGRASIDSRFELELTCGQRVLVPSGFDAAELSRLVATLEEMAPAAEVGTR